MDFDETVDGKLQGLLFCATGGRRKSLNQKVLL